MIEAGKVDAPASPAAPESPVVTRGTSPLERFVKPAMERLQSIKPQDRPGTRERFWKWLRRCGLCIVREDNVVPMHLLIPEMVRTIGPGPLSDALQVLAGQPVEFGALPADVITDSALRCVKRLKHQADFLEWPLDRRDRWIKSQGYANFTTEPEALAVELERLGAVREGPSPQRLTYDEAVLGAPTEIGTAPVLPKAAAAMCRVLTVENIAPSLRVGMSKDDLKNFKMWLKVLGCRLGPDPRGCLETVQLTIMAGRAQQSTSAAAAQELQKQLVAELPMVLRYVLGNPMGPILQRAVDTDTEVDAKMKGFILGKKGENIKKLESEYGVRLSYQGGKFVGWISTSLLPDDGTAESLRGLGARLQQLANTASRKIESHISETVKKINEGHAAFEQRRKDRKAHIYETEMKLAASTPLKETGQYGASQEDRDHSRATDARKRGQRKAALAARDDRALHRYWKDGKHGGRHKSGEGGVGCEDHADAGQGPSGITEDLRAEWQDPIPDGFKSQLDAPNQKVPGSHPRHRGHKPGNLRTPFVPNAASPPKRKVIQRGYSDIYEGLGVDSSTEGDD